jgi:hypothetical protein
MTQIELGDEAKDTITGFQGIVIGVTKWIHGCRRITIQPKELKDSEPVAAHTFDEPQLVIVKKAQAETTGLTGGPGPVAARRDTPSRR